MLVSLRFSLSNGATAKLMCILDTRFLYSSLDFRYLCAHVAYVTYGQSIISALKANWLLISTELLVIC